MKQDVPVVVMFVVRQSTDVTATTLLLLETKQLYL